MMKRYLFLKLGLTILVFAAASPRTQVSQHLSQNRDNKQSNNHQNVEHSGSSSQQEEPKNNLEDYQGVMGKPGVDFPILTYIPRTGFTCRGKKSGYYADLDTNCQVFHICEEGRKVSFLCPNGTIFQQSDLICDWWFKVDCATAPNLYDESAEQLYEENIRRKENRRVLEQERRASKLHRQESQRKQATSRENQNFVKKDINQYTSQSRYESREEYANTFKETQIPSETASFVNNRYNSEQQKKYYKTINDVVSQKTTSDFNSNIKSTTERIVNRGSRTYNSFSKAQFRNQVPDIIKTTTQHTIYSPTVPPFTTRHTTKSPNTTPYTLKTTKIKPAAGFYITKEIKSSTHAPLTELPSTTLPAFTSKVVSTTAVPLNTNYDDTLYTTPLAETTRHPLVGSEIVTGNLEQNTFKSEITTDVPFEDITFKNTVPSVPTPFRSRSISVESKSGNQFTYLPKVNDTIPTPKPTIPTEYTTLNVLPTVTENLNNMIKTLEEIDKDPAINLEKQFSSRPGLNIPPSAGPKTLHSLAIYFASALDNLVSSNENDTVDEELSTTISSIDDTQVTLLSQTTQDKYNSLFEYDENSTTTEESNTKPDLELRSLVEYDTKNNDLDSQQSRGPVSSTPRIRQLAQVFTQALSAYLDDPDTFKRVLEEIRPTEPPVLSENLETSTEMNTETTTLPTTATTEYKSYTKEEDEVLDFSDADKSSTYRPFNDNIKTTESTVYIRSTTETSLNEISTHLPLEPIKNETLSKHIPTPNPIALHLNHGLKLTNVTLLQDIEAIDESSTEDATESDDYFPFNTGEDEEDIKLKATAKPYGHGVKPENTTPINIASEIPPIFSRWNNINLSLNSSLPSDSLLPPFKISLLNKKEYNNSINEEYLQSAHSQSFISHGNSITSDRKGKQFNFETTTEYDSTTTAYTTTTEYTTTTAYTSTITYAPESTTYFETTTREITEPTITSTTEASTTQTTTFIPPEYTTETTTTESETTTSKVPSNHWSTSPEVTKLWESTLYVDPLIINRNLGEDIPTTYRPEFTTLPYKTTTEDYVDDFIDLKFTSTTEEATSTIPSTTEFNLYTTVIDLGIHTLLNATELEIASSQAHQIFGNLNSTEQDILIEKMKEAESNSTVRRLILLLVSTCDASLSNNKTVQETRNSIIHALLNVPTTNNVPEVNSRFGKQLNIETTTTTIETTSEATKDIIENIESPNKVNDIKDVNQDTRALELLRSLYSLAAKWGKK